MGAHCGELTDIRPCLRTGRAEYFGALLNQAARVASVANGGQMVVTERLLSSIEANGIKDSSLASKLYKVDLGTFAMKGIPKPMRLFQVSDHNLNLRPFSGIKPGKARFVTNTEQSDTHLDSHAVIKSSSRGASFSEKPPDNAHPEYALTSNKIPLEPSSMDSAKLQKGGLPLKLTFKNVLTFTMKQNRRFTLSN